MTQDIQLTAAELEMVKLKREQDELKKREDELREQARLEKEIAAKLKSIERDQLEASLLLTAVRTCFKEIAAINPQAELIQTNSQRVAKIQDYLGNSKYQDRWKREYSIPGAYIKIGYYDVVVTKHNGSYKMYISGPEIDYRTSSRGYTRAKKVVEVINTTISDIRYREEQNQKKLNAVESTVAKMKSLYPGASISSGKDHISYGGGYRRATKYETIDIVTIVFKNGIQIVYRVYTDGSLARRSINFNTKADHWYLMNLLSSLDMAENTEK